MSGVVSPAYALCLVSVLLGLNLLATSSLFLIDWIQSDRSCRTNDEYCGGTLTPCHCMDINPTVPGAALGLVAALIQLASGLIVLFQNWRLYCGLQLFSTLASFAGFIFVFSSVTNGLEADDRHYYSSPNRETYFVLFLTASGMLFVLGTFTKFAVEHVLWNSSKWKANGRPQQQIGIFANHEPKLVHVTTL